MGGRAGRGMRNDECLMTDGTEERRTEAGRGGNAYVFGVKSKG